MHIRKIAITTAYTAAVLSTNYLLTPLPNVKLFDVLVFVATFIHGVPVGLSVASLTWIVYGVLNPWGAAPPPLIAVLIACESSFVALAAFARRFTFNDGVDRSFLWGFLGAAGAFLYDFATNLYVGIFFYNDVLTALILGIPFTAAHITSNLIFFMLLGPRIADLTLRLRCLKP